MNDPAFINGWKTALDGTRTQLTKDEGAELWRMVEDSRARQAAAYPTTHDALRAYIDADERMRDLGWVRTIFNLADGAEVAIAERGSTGIFRGFWSKPYLHYCDCVSHMGKHFLKRIGDLTPDELATMERCEADHKVMMEAETKAMQRLQAFMEDAGGDA